MEFAEKESVELSMALDDSLFRGRQIKVCLHNIWSSEALFLLSTCAILIHEGEFMAVDFSNQLTD